MNDKPGTLYGPDGRPIQLRSLTRERARPSWTGLRRVWQHETVASGLTPERLAAVLRDADEGNPRDFLTLAEEMEERDLHYSSVLATRKRAVARLKPVVEAASDDAKDVELADAVRSLVRRPQFSSMVIDALDALGKGYSLIEILWSRGESWEPECYQWRDPRWFVPDRDDGTTLRLYDEADPVYGVPLEPYKWIHFRPKIKSGLPIRGGLARLAAIAYLCKSFTVTDWVRFSEVFGQPFRVGKYGPDATEEDIGRLIAALANLGTDAAAVVPESMMIEFATAGGSSSSGGGLTYEKLCLYLDRQVSKGVVGQTMTADEGSSRSQAEVHDLVRQEITESDAPQLAACLNRDLIEPYIKLNWGPQEAYPVLTLPLPDSGDIAVLASALEKLVPLGLRVGASTIRDRMGLPEPAKDAEILGQPSEPQDSSAQARALRLRAIGTALAAQAKPVPPPDAIDALLDQELEDWEEMMAPLVEPVQKLLESAKDLEDFHVRLVELVATLKPDQVADLLARAGFATRLGGNVGADIG